MDKNGNQPRSMLMLAASMLIFGTIGIFRRYIPLSSGVLAFTRGLIGTVFLLVCRRLGSRGAGGPRVERRQLPAGLLVFSGALIGINWILLFEAYNYTTVATATLCYYMQPIIVILLSPLVFRERLTLKKGICTLAALAGMVLVSGAAGEGVPRGDALRGILYGLGAAVLYASVVILNKWIRNVDPWQKTILQLASAAVCLLPYLLVTGQFVRVEVSGFSILMLLIVGIVHTGIAYALYFGSTDGLRAQTIALFSYIDPVSALILSALVLREPMTWTGLAGAILVLGAALFSEL